MDALHFRHAGLQDCRTLAWLNLQLIREGADTGPSDPLALRRRFQRWLGSGRYRAVLFDCGGAVQAYALYREQKAEIYLRQFLVLPGARRHGIGRSAFELMRRRLWSPGKRLTVEALSGNAGGLAFWRAIGYRDCAVTLEIDAEAAARPRRAAVDSAVLAARVPQQEHDAAQAQREEEETGHRRPDRTADAATALQAIRT